ncbi:hypothetical protein EYZ11_009307 [Aspergillus tanneri]|uniref:Uncharacterized protein n=1 Tax=Aspergillus tanneri TaxID=1220188 RepID=A0A4S3JAC6_9EURO|nr:hypothetical protein EYZ11_009307 [Aspergillus tanneri]
MAAYSTTGEQKSTDDFKEKINSIVDRVLELSLVHDCRTYFLVDYDKGILTFNSVEDRSWPPPDRTLVSSVRREILAQRLTGSQEILRRITEEERKELIQLLVYISDVAKGPSTIETSQTQREDESGQNLDPEALLEPRAGSEDYESDSDEEEEEKEIEGDENEKEGGRRDSKIVESEGVDWCKAFTWNDAAH